MGVLALALEAIFQQPLCLLALGSVVASWLVWRLWRFSIEPLLKRDEPQELPYCIPFIGHAFAFFNDIQGLLTRARLHFDDTRKPFTIVAAGIPHHILTDPMDAYGAYKTVSSLSLDSFVETQLLKVGASKECVRLMSKAPSDLGRQEIFPNPRDKPLLRLSRDLHLHQLYPGPELDDLEGRFSSHFDCKMTVESILMESGCCNSESTKERIVLPLEAWIIKLFAEPGQTAYFGTQLGSLDPGFIPESLVFDDLSWQFLLQYPQLLSRRFHAAKSRMHSSLKKYFDLPPEDRQGEVWWTKALEREMRALGVGSDDIAAVMVLIYWGLNTNTRKSCFWLMRYLLEDPKLLNSVREETQPAMSHDGKVKDSRFLEENCPRLAATYDETLRMTSFAQSIRLVEEDITIRGTRFRKGSRVIVPFRQLHIDEEVFGQDVQGFHPERLLKNPKLTRSPSWRPFGGGTSTCPGRFLAKRVVFTWIALLVHRFDVSVKAGQTLPERDTLRYTLGIVPKKADCEDVLICLQPRNQGALEAASE